MAKLYVSNRVSKSFREQTRCDNREIEIHLRTWNSGIKVSAEVDEETGRVYFSIWETDGSMRTEDGSTVEGPAVRFVEGFWASGKE